jgi:predicted SAM-dependent methyltransferase
MDVNKLVEIYEEGKVKLDIGCGPAVRPGYTGCDLHEKAADVIMDLRKTWPFKDNSVGTVYASNILEHFDGDEIHYVIAEAWRVLEYDGCLIALVPHGHSDLQIGDPHHKMRWLEYTPHRFCAKTFDRIRMGQGLPYRSWKVETVLLDPHPDFAGYDEKAFFFARKHFVNVFQHLAFVMRKTHA